jgi:MFS family permease
LRRRAGQVADRLTGLAADRFVFLYALAWAGGTIAYTPLLTILLPARVAELAGREAGVDWLAMIAFAGAIAASLGGILFGTLSDLTRNRRGWVAAGLALVTGLLVSLAGLKTLPELIAAIILWQLALNMMLGPLSAWAADLVPDRRKGLLGGLLSFAPAIGALSGAIVTLPGLATHSQRLWIVAGLVLVCVLPILLLKPPAAGQPVPVAEPAAPQAQKHSTGNLVRMWLARFAVQIAEALLFAYLFFWLGSLSPGVTDNDSARLFTVVMLSSAPLALLLGRWSDQRDRPIAPLLGCAAVSAAGLAAMAFADSLWMALSAYWLFGVASAVFLALHSAQTFRILPRPDRRGRHLGLFNLSNTLPSLVMPLLAILLIPAIGYQGLFLLLALLAGGAALLLVSVVPEKPATSLTSPAPACD